MLGGTHILAGATVGIVVAEVTLLGTFSPVAYSLAVVGGVIGGLLPDIDLPQSKISNIKWLMLLRIYEVIFQKIIRFIAWFCPKEKGKTLRRIAGHRGFTHSIPWCLLQLEILIIFSNGVNAVREYQIFSAGMMTGIISHLFLDLLSGGTYLFCPFYNKRVSIREYRTGEIEETFIYISLRKVIKLYLLIKGIKAIIDLSNYWGC